MMPLVGGRRGREAGEDGNFVRRARNVIAVGVPALFLLAACADPLAVEDPDIVEPDDLTGQAGLNARRLGAFGEFAVAFGGSGENTEGNILASGLLADEFVHGGTFPTRVQIDARRVDNQNSSLTRYYRVLHRARRAAEGAAAAWSEADTLPEAAKVIAEMNNLAGYTYVFFGENFCSGVPFSRITEAGELEFGDGKTTDEMFGTAISRFEAAMTSAENAGNTDLRRSALVGKARALINMAEFQEASQIVSSIPTGWEHTVKYSPNTDRQENGVMVLTNLSERWSVANNEGGGLNYRDAFRNGDPRTPWVVAADSAAFNEDFIGYHEKKYPERGSPIPLASGIEARLIEAEAALQAGNKSKFEQIHNRLRARVESEAVDEIDADTMSRKQMVDFQFRERAFWLWLTGHRHGDLRRMIRQYDRTEDQVFPSGSYFKPQFTEYGDRVVFPIPREERNNPNLSGKTNLCNNLNA